MINQKQILGDALSGKEIETEEANTLMCSDIHQLVEIANNIREIKKGNIITYSKKVFIPLTNLCRDTCSYCAYKKEPNDSGVTMMKPEQILDIAEKGKKAKCTEVLFITGERPEQKYDEARKWLRSVGYSTTTEYIIHMSELVLKKVGLLPHTNPGNMTREEMIRLKEVNPSLGMMLENVSDRLCRPGMPHEFAPSKDPKARLNTLETAGQLKIPFTTGLLVGMGETPEELVNSLFAIKQLHERYGHIQEIIIQNFSAKADTPMALAPTPTLNYMLRAIAIARIIMPEMNIQVPPNLNPNHYSKFLKAGINDWGGISPVTVDYVNPEFPWPNIAEVKYASERNGFKFKARLPVYPEYIRKEGFLSHDVSGYVSALADEKGLVREDYLRE
ncbi:MAG: 7,8-didemethyl-8-hydroxy-5-deazariboflavin synthase CofG [Nitrososphaerales archaeon]